ncbi:hypothetical protein C3747_16g510 [Trypanosoma cruzi]|uniref:Uncharacterized protein n=1 Tax=Trypanosoma cruzi TaxID=5693 RepID=A0A2V2XCX1_TRYCR|nr:hypothetical protein C3747_16g510 [Trypanosoma cruzi]
MREKYGAACDASVMSVEDFGLSFSLMLCDGAEAFYSFDAALHRFLRHSSECRGCDCGMCAKLELMRWVLVGFCARLGVHPRRNGRRIFHAVFLSNRAGDWLRAAQLSLACVPLTVVCLVLFPLLLCVGRRCCPVAHEAGIPFFFCFGCERWHVCWWLCVDLFEKTHSPSTSACVWLE